MGLFSKDRVELGDGGLSVESDYFSYEIPYSEIRDVHLRDPFDFEVGDMVEGSRKVLSQCGKFRNREYGPYSLLFHVTSKLFILLDFGKDGHLVFNLKDMEGTKNFYRRLKNIVKTSSPEPIRDRL